jgi:integrase
VERTDVRDLCEMLRNDYRANERCSLPRVEASLAHLTEHCDGTRACDLTTDRIIAYVAVRQGAKAANATINRELAALKRMFRLGEIAGKVAQWPYIPMLQENNARKGFFEAHEFQALLAALPETLKPVGEVAYVTGWRIRAELLTRRWSHVDFDTGWIRLEPGETKNREDRMFPMTPTLRAVLERQRAHTRAIERATGQVIPWSSTVMGGPSDTIAAPGSPPARRPRFRTGSPMTSGARPSGTWSAPGSRARPP